MMNTWYQRRQRRRNRSHNHQILNHQRRSNSPFDTGNKHKILRRPSSRTTPTALLIKMVAVLVELLGGQECRAKMTSLRSFSMPLIPYPAQQCQPSASESSAVQRSSLPLRETLEEDIIEACECLKVWWRNSLIEQQFGHFEKQKQ